MDAVQRARVYALMLGIGPQLAAGLACEVCGLFGWAAGPGPCRHSGPFGREALVTVRRDG
jgi:hypothetical protein